MIPRPQDDRVRVARLDLATSVATIRAHGRAVRGAGAGREAPSAGAGGTTLLVRLLAVVRAGHLTVPGVADGRTRPNAAEDGQTHPSPPAETPLTPDPRSGAHRSGVIR